MLSFDDLQKLRTVIASQLDSKRKEYNSIVSIDKYCPTLDSLGIEICDLFHLTVSVRNALTDYVKLNLSKDIVILFKSERLKAIRQFRDLTGVSLNDAKNILEELSGEKNVL